MKIGSRLESLKQLIQEELFRWSMIYRFKTFLRNEPYRKPITLAISECMCVRDLHSYVWCKKGNVKLRTCCFATVKCKFELFAYKAHFPALSVLCYMFAHLLLDEMALFVPLSISSFFCIHNSQNHQNKISYDGVGYVILTPIGLII